MNAAILVGWRVAGAIGMITAVIGTILPPMLILTAVSFFYQAFAANRYVAFLLKGMQAGVVAGILDVVCNLGGNVLKTRQIPSYVVMVAAFVATFVFGINVIYIILAAAAAGILMEIWKRKKGVHE